jgi:hypothetical protein
MMFTVAAEEAARRDGLHKRASSRISSVTYIKGVLPRHAWCNAPAAGYGRTAANGAVGVAPPMEVSERWSALNPERRPGRFGQGGQSQARAGKSVRRVTRSFASGLPGVIMVAIFSRRGCNVDDDTVRIRTRQSLARHKLTLTICALLAVVGFVGWLTSL